MKYVIFKNDKGSLFHPVVFGDHTSHSQVKLEQCHPISAGFFTQKLDRSIEVFGRSESLDLVSDPRDAKLIELMLLNYGTSFFLNYEELEL